MCRTYIIPLKLTFYCSIMDKRTVAPLKILIISYNGDPDLLDFFIEQIKVKQDHSNLSDSQTLFFIKSKLIDKALKAYATSAPCQRATTSDELFSIFKKLFKTESSQNIALQYNTIKFNGTESIRIYANKLQNLVMKRFPQLSPDSIAQILIAKFTDTIPPHFKLYLQPLNHTRFDDVVDALATYQEILAASDSTSSVVHPSFATIHNTIHSQNITISNPTHEYLDSSIKKIPICFCFYAK